MREQLEIKSIQDATNWGRVLSNRRKVILLLELSKGPMPKKKIAEVLGVKMPTVTHYVRELIDLGIVEEYPTLHEGKRLVHIVQTRCSGVLVSFINMTKEGGWRDE